MVTQSSSTLADIKRTVRLLTASPSINSLTESDLEWYINYFYNNDFPYSIKLDQTKVVYTIFTSPNIDRYPVNVNEYQGFRNPVYIEGIQGNLYKDRQAFYNTWPRFPVLNVPASGDGVTTSFSFTIGQIPFLSTMVVIGTKDTSDNVIKIVDDGGRNTVSGNLLLLESDNVGDLVPPIPNTSPIPPINPIPSNTIGSVNYVTGEVLLEFPVAPKAAEPINIWVSPYRASRPYSILFFNNEFIIRPVPNKVYKLELEAYRTPTQFMEETSDPGLNQWMQYISVGVARRILRDRGDFEGVNQLEQSFKEQEGMALERQAVEEIGVSTATIYDGSLTQPYPFYAGWWS